MLFYCKDWLEGTAEMTKAEKGVYIDLLAHHHQKGSLPGEPQRLARMVGMTTKQFNPIWDYLSCKFYEDDGRLFNKKLKSVMADRELRSHKNTISGTFASVLRKLSLNKKDYAKLRDAFNIDDFLSIPKDSLSERLTEWSTEWLKNGKGSIGNEDEDGNKDIKHKYGQFKNVLLTDSELQKLKDKFNGEADKHIENMSESIERKGYKYKSHYLAILKWDRENKKKTEKQNYKNFDE